MRQTQFLPPREGRQKEMRACAVKAMQRLLEQLRQGELERPISSESLGSNWNDETFCNAHLKDTAPFAGLFCDRQRSFNQLFKTNSPSWRSNACFRLLLGECHRRGERVVSGESLAETNQCRTMTRRNLRLCVKDTVTSINAAALDLKLRAQANARRVAVGNKPDRAARMRQPPRYLAQALR